MSVVSLAIVDRDDRPIYCSEFPTKYHWKQESLASEEELFGLNLSSSNDGDDILECSLKQQFILQTGLDRFVHLAGPPPGYHWRDAGATGTDACFVGLLCPVEDFRVYGYVLTTKVKIIMVVEDDELALLNDQMSVDDRIKTLMVKIHSYYVEEKLNPFAKLEGPIESETFRSKVGEEVEAFNRALS